MSDTQARLQSRREMLIASKRKEKLRKDLLSKYGINVALLVTL